MSCSLAGKCGHCGEPMRGYAAINDTPLCHPDEGLDCYRLVTVFGHPMPCGCAAGVREEQFESLLDAIIQQVEDAGLEVEMAASLANRTAEFIITAPGEVGESGP